MFFWNTWMESGDIKQARNCKEEGGVSTRQPLASKVRLQCHNINLVVSKQHGARDFPAVCKQQA
jgi:hypothetical protein